jgi:hypothetical protein
MSALRRSARLAALVAAQNPQTAQELIEKQAKEIQEIMHLYSPNTQPPTQILSIAKTATCREMLLNSPKLREVILERMTDFDSKIAIYGLVNKFPEECRVYAEASAAIRSVIS